MKKKTPRSCVMRWTLKTCGRRKKRKVTMKSIRIVLHRTINRRHNYTEIREPLECGGKTNETRTI